MRLNPHEARTRFTASPVARLATADASGMPHIVPVTFAALGDTLYLVIDDKPKRAHDPSDLRNLRRLRNMRENPRVSLLADHYADDWSTLWWARADGDADIWEYAPGHSAAMADAVALLAAKYAPYRQRPPRGPVAAIRVARWTGWSMAD